MKEKEMTSVVSTEEQEMYKENILEQYKHPQNKRELQEYSVKHKEYNPLCGDEITVYLNIKNGTVKDIGWAGQGCAISQAAMSMLSEKIKGMPVTDVKKVSKDDMLTLLGIPISYTRMKCATLSLKAVSVGVEHVRD